MNIIWTENGLVGNESGKGKGCLHSVPICIQRGVNSLSEMHSIISINTKLSIVNIKQMLDIWIRFINASLNHKRIKLYINIQYIVM